MRVQEPGVWAWDGSYPLGNWAIAASTVRRVTAGGRPEVFYVEQPMKGPGPMRIGMAASVTVHRVVLCPGVNSAGHFIARLETKAEQDRFLAALFDIDPANLRDMET